MSRAPFQLALLDSVLDLTTIQQWLSQDRTF